MEGIRNYLMKDEKVLWDFSEKSNLIRGKLAHIAIILFLMVFFIAILIYISPTFDWMAWYVVLLLILIPISLFVISIFLKIKNFKEKMSKLQLSLKDLLKYNNYYAITKKRWIQKNYNLNCKIDFSKYPKGSIKQEKDVIFVDLEIIQVIYTFESHENIIAFYVEYDKENPEDANFGMILTLIEFRKAMRVLKEIFPIEREDKDDSGEIVYFRK